MNHGIKVPNVKGPSGTYDRNETPVIGKPRDMGKGAQPEIFFEDVPGKIGKLQSPMGTGIPMSKK